MDSGAVRLTPAFSPAVPTHHSLIKPMPLAALDDDPMAPAVLQWDPANTVWGRIPALESRFSVELLLLSPRLQAMRRVALILTSSGLVAFPFIPRSAAYVLVWSNFCVQMFTVVTVLDLAILWQLTGAFLFWANIVLLEAGTASLVILFTGGDIAASVTIPISIFPTWVVLTSFDAWHPRNRKRGWILSLFTCVYVLVAFNIFPMVDLNVQVSNPLQIDSGKTISYSLSQFCSSSLFTGAVLSARLAFCAFWRSDLAVDLHRRVRIVAKPSS